jgi:hypothetical protein
MNWYKRAQSEIWKTPKKEHSPFDWEHYNTLSPDEQYNYTMERSERGREWDRSVQEALARGQISPEKAHEQGWLGGGAAHMSHVQPLPPVLYHVTTNKEAVIRDGLKSRSELKQRSGKGLGGGDSETISFTTDPEVAKDIYNAIMEGRKVATGELTIEEMFRQAISGETAQKPWIDSVLDYYGRGKKSPEELIEYFAGDYEYERAGLPSTVDEMNRRANKSVVKPATPWEPVESSLWVPGAYLQFRRRRTPTEKINAKFDFYKSWCAFREGAGGPMNPLFFSNDAEGLSQVPPDQIAILEFRARPGAIGYKVSALGEWRTWSGQAVEFVREIK